MKSIDLLEFKEGITHIVYLKHIISISQTDDSKLTKVKLSDGSEIIAFGEIESIADEIDKISEGVNVK